MRLRLPKMPTVTLQSARELIAIAGGVSFTYGAYLAWHPLGFLTAGILLQAPFVLRTYIALHFAGRQR